jgi:hypothetical protein
MVPRVARPKRTTGSETTFTLKFSPEERELVGRLVEARAKDLREIAGSDVDVTIASYLRWLIERDAQARGLAGPAAKRKK